MSSRSKNLLIASFTLLLGIAAIVLTGNGGRESVPPEPAGNERAVRQGDAARSATRVAPAEERDSATPEPAMDDPQELPDTGGPESTKTRDEESLESALSRVSVYYESDEVIDNFLNPEAFGEYRWHTTFMIKRDDGVSVDEIEYLIRNSKIDRGTTVLDWGCGMGWLVVHLAKTFGCRATGVNISERQLAYARELAAKEHVEHLVSFDLYPGKELPYPDGSFDIVYSQESLVHAPDKELAFGEIFRVLKPGGELSIQDWFADGDNGDWHALTRDIDHIYNTFLDTVQNTVRIWAELGLSDIVVIDLHEKLGADFVKPFHGYPFIRAVEGGAFTVAFVSARKPSS